MEGLCRAPSRTSTPATSQPTSSCYALHYSRHRHSRRAIFTVSAQAPKPADAGAPLWSRRAALLSLPLTAGLLSNRVLPAVAAPRLRSLGWSVPSELIVLNALEKQLKVYWLNYDGDPEFFGSLAPGSVLTLQTFESHAWRFMDASSGAVLAEHVAGAGQHLLRVDAAASAALAASGTAYPARLTALDASELAPRQQLGQGQGAQLGGGGGGGFGDAAGRETGYGVELGLEGGGGQQERLLVPAAEGAQVEVAAAAVPFEGFDGIGAPRRQYSLAQLREITIYPGGGNVILDLPPPYDTYPLEVSMAGPEALTLVTATGSLEQRRPSTLGTWTRSLVASGVEVQRVCITRMVDGVYYSRIVLSRPDASLCSLDATPGDALSLAIQLGRPVYVANEVARIHSEVLAVFARRRAAMEAAAAAGGLDEEEEAAADAAAQATLDSLTARLPAAPHPVRPLVLDRSLEA